MNDSSFQFYSRAKIVSGTRALEGIPLELSGYDRRNPLVITGPNESSVNSTKRFIDAIADSGMVIRAFYDNVTSADEITAAELAGVFKSKNCDSLIAIGGTTVLEMARKINLSACDTNNMVPMFLVPTAVIRDTDMRNSVIINSKIIVHPALSPDLIFIDSSVKTPEWGIKCINSALGAFAHAVDGSFGSVNPIVSSFRQSAISLLYQNIPRYLKKPDDRKARTAVINGIIHGGIALGNSESGLIDTLTEAIGSKTQTPSGMIMAMLLPSVIDYRIMEGGNPDDLLMAMAGVEKFCSIVKGNIGHETVRVIKQFMVEVLKSVPAETKKLHLSEIETRDIASGVSETTGIQVKKISAILHDSLLFNKQEGK